MIDRPEITTEEAQQAVDEMSLDLFRSEDARAWTREMCDLRDIKQGVPVGQGTVTTAEVRKWLEGQQCGRMLGIRIGVHDES